MRAALLSSAMLVAAIGLAHAQDETCIPLDHASPQMLAWLKGEWTNRTGPSEAHQFWSAPINGILIGHEIIATAGATSFAFLRISRNAHGLSLFVSINGAEPIELKAIELCSAQVVFEGDTSAYPSRIVYLNTVLRHPERPKAPINRVTERNFQPRPQVPFM
jgi:hypothetical protein